MAQVSGPVLDDPVAWHLAEALTDCLCTILEAEAPVQCCCTQFGEAVAWDSCNCRNGRDGQAWVRVASMFPTATFPQPYTGNPGPCGGNYDGWAVQLELGVLRCAPSPDSRGRLPSCEQNTAAARRALADAHIMRRAVMCCDWYGRDAKLIVGAWQPVGPDGGCHGGVLPVTVQSFACVCDG